VPRGILSTLEELPGITIDRAPVGQVMMMYVSRRDAEESDRLMADPLVRRAAASAMDQKSFVQGVLDGHGEVIPSVAPVEVFGEHAGLLEGVPFDREEAARLLDEAGWTLADGEEFRTRDGETLDLTIIYARVDLTVAEFVQSQLREVGFNAQVEQLDAGAYSDRLADGSYDLDISLPNQNDANPAFLLSLRWYSKARGDNAPWVSPGPDTEFERIIDQTQETEDADELQRLAAEGMRELVAEEVGGIPLAGTWQIFAMREGIQGFQPHPSGTNQRWSTVYIAE
jgi:peptide/nickel transport system substrate-binding protein